MYTYAITIGRNVTHTVTGKQQPLGATSWRDFANRVRAELEALAIKRQLEATSQHQPDAYFIHDHEGHGQWDGIEEDSYRVELVSEFYLAGTGDMVQRLCEIGQFYQQQAIAITRGESEIIDLT